MTLLGLMATFFYIGLFTIGGGLVAVTIMYKPIVEGALISAEEFYNMFDRAYALGKQEKDTTTVIQGWVAIDEAYNECYLHTNKPTHEVRPIADTGDYESHWGSEEQTYLLDADLFPDMDSNSEPQECEIIIKRKKK